MGRIIKRIKKNLNFWKSHKRRALVYLIIILVAFFVYKKVTAEPAGIETTTISREQFVADFTANGKIKAGSAVDLKFYSPGKLSWLGVSEGDVVRKWQGVASLDAIALNVAYQQALNSYRDKEASAEKILDDVKDHDTDESFAQKASRTTAEVARDNAWDQTLATRDNLRNAALVSPIAGTVLDTNNLVAGMNLTGSDVENRYIRIVDLSSLYFEANIDEVDYSKVSLGQEVNITVDAYPGESCSGTVTKKSQDGTETTGGVVTFPVEVHFVGCNLDYALGLNGQAHFVLTKKENALVIPRKYLVEKDGSQFVWKQTGSSVKEREMVGVKLGSTSGSGVEILEGLKERDIIIFIP